VSSADVRAFIDTLDKRLQVHGLRTGLTYSHSHSLPPTLTYSLSLSHPHSLSLTRSHSPSLPLSLSLSLSLSLTHSLSITLTHSHSPSPTHSHSLFLRLTYSLSVIGPGSDLKWLSLEFTPLSPRMQSKNDNFLCSKFEFQAFQLKSRYAFPSLLLFSITF